MTEKVNFTTYLFGLEVDVEAEVEPGDPGRWGSTMDTSEPSIPAEVEDWHIYHHGEELELDWLARMNLKRVETDNGPRFAHDGTYTSIAEEIEELIIEKHLEY
jgi:hypothetical protein